MEKFQPPNLMSVKQFLESNKAFSNGLLRRWISLAAVNGLNEMSVIYQPQSKIYIDQIAFFKWFLLKSSQNREVIARI